jgi:hypothetical protein
MGKNDMQQDQDTPDACSELERERAALQEQVKRQQNTIVAMRFALNEYTSISRAEVAALREQLVATQQLVEITRSYLAASEQRLARQTESYAQAVTEKEQLRAMLDIVQRNIFVRLFRRGGRIERMLLWPFRRFAYSGDSDTKATATQTIRTDGNHYKHS